MIVKSVKNRINIYFYFSPSLTMSTSHFWRGRLRRLLWILFTLTAVGLIFWQCALLISSFYTVSVSIKVHFQKLDFPAVTICNINPYK